MWCDRTAGNAVDAVGVLQPLAPLTEVLDNNPLMPSGAALFVSATVMLLDFSRPKWAPVTSKGKDWVLRCLKMCALFSICTLLLLYLPIQLLV